MNSCMPMRHLKKVCETKFHMPLCKTKFNTVKSACAIFLQLTILVRLVLGKHHQVQSLSDVVSDEGFRLEEAVTV
jgi:hypothetical protein